VPPAAPILLASPIDITTSLTIAGLGPNELAVSGNDVTEVFDVSAGVTVTISGITIEDEPRLQRQLARARAAASRTPGTLTLSNSVVTDNSATANCNSSCGAEGGGLENDASGILTVTDSTISGNSATGGCPEDCGNDGGGIENLAR